jgi:hypothetical protein
MKNQGNMSPPKANNSTMKDLSDSEADEISNNELKRKMIGMSDANKDVCKHLNEFKEYINK